MDGSFKVLKISILLCLFVGCNTINKQEQIGRNIINDNADLFISNLYSSPDKTVPIIIIKKVGHSDFFAEMCQSLEGLSGSESVNNCKKDFYEKINKEGFTINENTKYLQFDIDKFTSKQTVRFENNEKDIKEKEYIEVIFSNIYIDNEKGKAFIIVQDIDLFNGRYGGKTDVYFFEKKNSKWFYMKKEMLLTA
ncbi:hypothetical protein [Chryseobacterium jejuense]|uniref:hypothetical protein n=1 Tax=Chryseobacterium jejuense TaxID=445960 RepID=UPI001AE2DC66|nr:hypothetical protein [Chryseobacterium jejuense]MBP2617109.1 hypothetical protein [Chryseobacterium jejuense]